MLTTEDIDRMKYPEIGERVIENYDDMIEELCKGLILFIAEFTWPFIWGQCLAWSIHVVYYL
ncbi:MAG: hypothetical protein V3U75_01425 [Methylococcaceae bacterium]